MLTPEAIARIPTVRPVYRLARTQLRLLRFSLDYCRFRGLIEKAAARGEERRFSMRWRDRWAWVDDPRSAIPFEPHYTYHPAWAARVLAETRPERHVDIGSTLPFITMISAFMPVDYYEWRPPALRLSGLSCGHANLLALPFATNSLPSLSCMHTAEHVGMGRYGDPMDANGDLKAMAELERVLAPGGNLLFVVPIGGKAKIRYNADRVYTYRCVLKAFSALELVQFALILEDASGMLYDEEARQRATAQNCGCGCFWFRKPA